MIPIDVAIFAPSGASYLVASAWIQAITRDFRLGASALAHRSPARVPVDFAGTFVWGARELRAGTAQVLGAREAPVKVIDPL